MSTAFQSFGVGMYVLAAFNFVLSLYNNKIPKINFCMVALVPIIIALSQFLTSAYCSNNCWLFECDWYFIFKR